jgi:hypothetical protein
LVKVTDTDNVVHIVQHGPYSVVSWGKTWVN